MLSTDTALQVICEAGPGDLFVYDTVPDERFYPYLVIDVKPGQRRDNEDWDGWEFSVTIHSWYRGPAVGDRKVQMIQSRIDQILNRADIEVSGWRNISCRRSTVDILTDPDNVTKHGVQVFIIMLGEG